MSAELSLTVLFVDVCVSHKFKPTLPKWHIVFSFFNLSQLFKSPDALETKLFKSLSVSQGCDQSSYIVFQPKRAWVGSLGNF